ncbi:acetylglutamate kinase [Poritiphilus flavus]|uniref:Acetylglutamate kinase n=1 Tax=Poritiphilus flavus TaxID=2697053 RepID=A0A6L9EEN7_9FLAO|nr:acetylglutamate kinase [Poritiphilus flavus]NAS12769.1 acetylglutamate kinase [Poritiphilus flavus]
MRSQLSIVKIGGNVIENQEELKTFLSLFSQLPSPKILVHGGGKRATEISERMGIPAKLVNGRRITDAKGLEVVVMVYAGLLNKKLVAGLQALDCNAIGLSGADANAITAYKRPVKEIDYGFAGDVSSVNGEAIGKLLEAGFAPVFCALTHDGKGQMLNTNADTIAAELGIGMSPNYDVTLYYCFEKPGVLSNVEDESSVIQHIDQENYPQLLKDKVIANGMLPKLHNCFHALEHGVQTVCIGNLEMLKPNAQLFTTVTL